MSPADLLARFQQALPYETYVSQMRALVERGDEGLDEHERKLYEYGRLNLQRTRRIHRTYTPSAEVLALLSQIKEPQHWLVLNEYWCGEGAQTIPYIVEMIRPYPHLDLRVLPRDENLDVIDRYLTDGKRSIPILVALSAQGEERFRWGPRPAPATAILEEGLAAGQPKREVNITMHLWFARDKGRTLEGEFKALLR